jgi:lysophospholipase L1-like esterase
MTLVLATSELVAGEPGSVRPLRTVVPDVVGSYSIPCIQSSRDLTVRVEFVTPGVVAAEVSLVAASGRTQVRQVSPAAPEVEFLDLAPSEYAVELCLFGSNGEALACGRFASVGIGTVLCAIGDSLTEGYLGHGFWRHDLELTAASFPDSAVSRDGRNFPQYAPTTSRHKPDVNCFQSWLTRLNDILAESWGEPVFLANEGWGAYTTGHYLAMMRNNQGGWRDRMRLLKPTVWLIHLGVNDERQKIPAAVLGANLLAMVELLQADFGAVPEAIHIARPSYDYAPGAAAILQQYCECIDALVAERTLRPGPDFFAVFAGDRERWYGSDPVHPGPEGMDLMADLWCARLAQGRTP